MSDSDGSTQPNTPRSFVNDITADSHDDTFAWLRPHSLNARDAFDASVNHIIKHPALFAHVRRFLSAQRRDCSVTSIYTEHDEEAPPGPPKWTGAFKLRLQVASRPSAQGWYLGSARGHDALEVDMLLAPPTRKWAALTAIAGKHARLYLHEQTSRVMLEARHTVTITKKGVEVIRGSACRVLEHGELIEIGSCSYVLEHAALYTADCFRDDLTAFMGAHAQEGWQMNTLLSPTSLCEPIVLGHFYCSAGAFAQGTFGKISAGWGKDGCAVAVKHFKNPGEQEISAHRQIMGCIGEHVSPG